ncbi:hypothetical protein RB614_24990 [Phytohabitans sp. ZYX-F-186]|uniref:Uncharacterized protein n=1 Tax=Phytohabitans maris TaxID=3071409 RepID=A0ABU0ZL51_9ACTN|nr:hypothetical protein [Phytohabitans sp. ZYX-F-186]MDQ7907782.1 hypothetical protein [Phytohabitans sp. ZYX-F-186]
MTDERYNYWGYETSGNTELQREREALRHMPEGRDGSYRYYPPLEAGSNYPSPTVDWDDPRMDEDSDEYRAAYANDSVERIYKRVMAQDSAAVRRVAHQWRNTYHTLDELADRIYDLADKLRSGGGGSDKGWQGKGAEAFMARGPGATLKSIDDWKYAATIISSGIDALADKIDHYQGRMETFYEEYKSHMVSRSNEFLGMYGFDSVGDLEGQRLHGFDAGESYVNIMRHASDEKVAEARQIQADMAESYRTTMWQEFAGAKETRYEGPGDAVQHNQAFVERWMTEKFAPNITPPSITQPNITPPTITPPSVDPALLKQLEKPLGLQPDITAPSVDQADLPSTENLTQNAPQITPPNVVMPPAALPPPAIAPPAIRQVGPAGPPALRAPGELPTGPGAGRLLNNLPGGGGPGVLRGASAPPSAEGLPPSPPQGARPGQGTPPPQIKRPGQPGAPSMPQQGQRGGGPDRSTPATPGSPGRPALENQFGGPPSTPASPVMRNPRSTPGGDPRDPRRGTPGIARPGVGGQPPAPGRPDAVPPVLGRPTGGTPSAPERQTARPPAGSRDTGPLANPLAPPPPPTSSPIVGRTPRPEPRAETAGRVVRANKGGSSGYEAQIGSRRREQEPVVSKVDAEFDKIAKLLDKEAPWRVATPGGGVLDAAPTPNSTPTAEPKPVIGG